MPANNMLTDDERFDKIVNVASSPDEAAIDP